MIESLGLSKGKTTKSVHKRVFGKIAKINNEGIVPKKFKYDLHITKENNVIPLTHKFP